jgi:hypothetical protein
MRRTAMQRRYNARQARRPDRRPLLLFRQRDIDAAAANIVEQVDWRSVGLGDRLDRQTDHRVRPKQPARIFDRHIVGADMHTVGFCGKRHIDAVVDHERHAQRRERFLDRPCRLDHLPSLADFVAQLNERRAAFRAKPGQFRKRASAGAFRIDNGVEPKIDGNFTIGHQETFRLVRISVRSSR